MTISSLMRTSAAGLAAQANRLGTVADNIANVNTVGYKRAATEFSSLIPSQSTASYIPGSVDTTVRQLIGDQGVLATTTSPTDLAVSGNGFFVVTDADGTPFMTRAGNFVKDGAGDLVNGSGFYLMGYSLQNGSAVNGVANGTTGLQRVNIGELALEAVPSTEGTLFTNLPADAAIIAPADLPSVNAATADYTAKSSLVVTADLGRQVTLDVYWAKTAAETWEITVYDRADEAAGGEFPYTAAALVTDTLTFDATTGALAGASPTDITIPVPNGSNVVLDLSETSQLATDYTVLEANVNGNGPSAVDRIEFDEEGVMYAVYENGSRVASYQIPLANVTSPDNLQPLPGDIFTTSATSGEMQIGFPNQSGFGSLQASALEQSTVDLADELTRMIEAQRHYSVNSKVFQTGADLLDVLVNLKR